MPKLTKRTVDALKSEERDRFVWDDDVKGLGLKITPAGRKVFIFQYRLGGRSGTTQRVKIGDYGAVTPEQARREANRLRGEVAAGRSPALDRARNKAQIRADREAPTVTDLAK